LVLVGKSGGFTEGHVFIRKISTCTIFQESPYDEEITSLGIKACTKPRGRFYTRNKTMNSADGSVRMCRADIRAKHPLHGSTAQLIGGDKPPENPSPLHHYFNLSIREESLSMQDSIVHVHFVKSS